MRSIWIKTALLLAAIWLVAGGVIFWVRSAKTTPESIAKYIDAHSPKELGAGERAKVIEKVADQLNQLAYEQRREVRMSKRLDQFFRSLDATEQGRFLDLTLPTGFKQMMDSLNKMDRAQRQRFVTKALADMRSHEDDERPPRDDAANAERIINEGFKSFYSEASAETKMDVAPLIEQLQKNLQGLR